MTTSLFRKARSTRPRKNASMPICGPPTSIVSGAGRDSYRAVISSRVSTTGHVGSEGLGQLLAVCEASGNVLITVNAGVWQDDIHLYLLALVRDGKTRIIDQMDSYVSTPGDPNTIPSFGV